MPKRTWDKDYAGVWYIKSTVPGSNPPRPDLVFYINYRCPGERRKYDEKIGRKSEGWKPGTVNAVRIVPWPRSLGTK
jgi:hypothetical protein